MAAKLMDNGRAAIRITAIDERPAQQALVLLVQHVNSNMSAPSIGDLDTNLVRHEPLLERQGVAVSGHIVVSTIPRMPPASLPRYLCLLEEVPGLGRSVLQPFLRKEFKEVAIDWAWPDETDNNREKHYHPVVEMHTLPDITLREELEDGGAITGFEFYQHVNDEHGIDEHASIRESKRIVVLKATSQQGILEQITRLIPFYREKGYSELKVRYKNRNGRQKTGPMGMNETDVADTLLGRSSLIYSDQSLAQCHENIVLSLVDQMIAALQAARGD
ncbi:hypothetical protein [Thiocystis violacea]|uniref:hypothetical protein n=1 Tax=Thiocystis violacea TaxID=13725 RepID=UPI0019035142|nr:hypothetical protein [Thiocystis violacea]